MALTHQQIKKLFQHVAKEHAAGRNPVTLAVNKLQAMTPEERQAHHEMASRRQAEKEAAKRVEIAALLQRAKRNRR